MNAPSSSLVTERPNRYGWVIVAACALMIFVTYGLVYSYSIFFKPLAAHFQWDRSSVSLIYSLAVIIRGAASIGIGWLADKFSVRWVMVFCGLMMGVGYLLSSRVTGLWQFFFTYAVIEAIGMSGAWGVCTAVPSRWFSKNRGLILGIVTAGSGMGTLLIVPFTERIVAAYDWSQAFVICGIGAGALMVIAALFLRNPPAVPAAVGKGPRIQSGASIAQAVRDPRLWLITLAFLFFFFGSQIIMVHLVNYATDIGISPLIAATFVSVIGAVSVVSRIAIGPITEKIGLYKGLVITCFALAATFVLLLYTRAPWSFYLCAALYGIPYGGEVTLIPLILARFFGTRAMATLMGVMVFVIGIGGALGAWYAGWIFDMTDSYSGAFITGAVFAMVSIIMVFFLQRADKRNDQDIKP
jgi:MFS family permease